MCRLQDKLPVPILQEALPRFPRFKRAMLLLRLSRARLFLREPNVSSDSSSITTRRAGGKQSEEIRHVHEHASTQTRQGLRESKAVTREERRGQAGVLGWSEMDVGSWRNLTAHGCWDLEIIFCLSVKTRCKAILHCCPCCPICHGPEWKWPAFKCVCVCEWRISKHPSAYNPACRRCRKSHQIKVCTRTSARMPDGDRLVSRSLHTITHAGCRFSSQLMMGACDS